MDIQRTLTHPGGRKLLIGKWRGGYSVAVFHKGTYHSIGGFGGTCVVTGKPKAPPHAFETGVQDGQDHTVRLAQVQWCQNLSADQLPTEDIDPHWR